jgi:hypothetical protein
MLLPSKLAGMKLGCRWNEAEAQPITVGASASLVNLNEYMRITMAPRIMGNNDLIGDCVETAAANAVQTKYARNGTYGPISNGYVEGLYSAITGYVPGNPSTDLGTDPNALFYYWQSTRIGMYRLASAIRLNPQSEPDIRTAIVETGGVMLIVELATEQQNQRVWMPAGVPGSWGGHAVWADSFAGALTFSTSWGEAMPIDRSFFKEPGFVVGAYRLELEAA